MATSIQEFLWHWVMEQPTYKNKLATLAAEAVVMDTENEGVQPDVLMDSGKVYILHQQTVQEKAHIRFRTSGCVFLYGNDALRRKGGCCICLLMASGLSAKRLSVWMADVQEGELSYTTFLKRFKLAVCVILTRWSTHLHRCVDQSKMDDSGCKTMKCGDVKTIRKQFLLKFVNRLSRLWTGKTGRTQIWGTTPPNWPPGLIWKNPTSHPKDNIETLEKKFQSLDSLVPDEKLGENEKIAIKDFKSGDLNSVDCFLILDHATTHLNELQILFEKRLVKNPSSTPAGVIFDEHLKALVHYWDSLKSTSKKRQNNNPADFPRKRTKTERLNSVVDNSSGGRSECQMHTVPRPILPKRSLTACPAPCTDEVIDIVTSQSLAVSENLSKNTYSHIGFLQSPSAMHFTYCLSQNINNDEISQNFSYDSSSQYINRQDSSENISSQDSLHNISSQDSLHNISSQDSLHNISRQDSLHNISSKDSLHNISSQDSLHNISSQDSLHNISSQNSLHNISSQDSLHNISSQDSLHKISSQDSLHNISSQDSLHNISSQDSLHNISSQDSLHNISSQDSLHNISSQDSLHNISSQDSLHNISRQDSLHNISSIDSSRTGYGRQEALFNYLIQSDTLSPEKNCFKEFPSGGIILDESKLIGKDVQDGLNDILFSSNTIQDQDFDPLQFMSPEIQSRCRTMHHVSDPK